MSFLPVIIHSSNRAGLKTIAPDIMGQLLCKVFFIFIISFCLSFIMTDQVFAQTGSSYYNPRDETFKLLGLKRAKEEYEKASKELERVKALFQEGHKSQRDLDDAQENYSN